MNCRNWKLAVSCVVLRVEERNTTAFNTTLVTTISSLKANTRRGEVGGLCLYTVIFICRSSNRLMNFHFVAIVCGLRVGGGGSFWFSHIWEWRWKPSVVAVVVIASCWRSSAFIHHDYDHYDDDDVDEMMIEFTFSKFSSKYMTVEMKEQFLKLNQAINDTT